MTWRAVALALALASGGCVSQQDRRWEADVAQADAMAAFVLATWEPEPGVALPWVQHDAEGGPQTFRVRFLPSRQIDPNTRVGYVVTELVCGRVWVTGYVLDIAGLRARLLIDHAPFDAEAEEPGVLVLRSSATSSDELRLRAVAGVVDPSPPIHELPAYDPNVLRSARREAQQP